MPNLNNSSNYKRYKEYFKKPRRDSALRTVLVSFREYGMFITPLVLAYLLFYYIVFENGGSENGQRGMYIIILISVLVVVIGSFFLRKLYRLNKFNRYSNMTVPLFKKNEWRCPHCKAVNNLLSPCKVCGIFPTLSKEKSKVLEKSPTRRTKKVQKQYDEYQSQFDIH